MEKNNVILLDYYQSGYGPTIRIDVSSMENMENLKEVFTLLANSSGIEVDFLALENVLDTSIKKFTMKSMENCSNDLELDFSNADTNNITLDWAMPTHEWERVVGLVQGLIDFDKPAHQYLTNEDHDEVVLELAYMERSDILGL